MNAYQLKFWPAVQRDRDIDPQNYDYLKTNSSSLGAVVRQDRNCLSLYRDPCQFFNATYLTAELKQLFKEVLGGLCRQSYGKNAQTSHVFPLVGDLDFSQTFLCLYHLTKHRQELPRVPQLYSLPYPESVQVAALTAFDLDIDRGIEVEPDFRIFTPWGYLAWQLGGSFAYSLVKIHDRQRVAPSQYLLRQFMGDRPTLILLEDFIEYVHSAIEILGTEDPFLPQILIFIQNLIAVIEKSSNTVLVYSLSTTSEESLLTAVENAIAPQEQTTPNNYIEPENSASLEDREIHPKIQQSILEKSEAIAVVSVDEHTYDCRPVSAPKRRPKNGAKIWTAKISETGSKIIPFPDRFSTQLGYLSHKLKPVASQHQTAKTGDRIQITKIVNPIRDRFTKDTAMSQDTAMPCPYRDEGAMANTLTFYQWHKRSEIDIEVKKLLARSPPK